MVNFVGDISFEIVVEWFIKCIDELNLSNIGGFWYLNGEMLFW